MANSFALDTLRQAILSQKIRESHGPSTRRSSNAAPSVSSDDVQFGSNSEVGLHNCHEREFSTDSPEFTSFQMLARDIIWIAGYSLARGGAPCHRTLIHSQI